MEHILRLRGLLWALLIGAACFRGAPAYAGDITLSGLLDTRAALAPGAGEAEAFSFGLEEYANLRLLTDIGDYMTVRAAFNLIAAAGTPARAADAVSAGGGGGSSLVSTGYVGGENYVAAMELERLYCQIDVAAANLEAGLMRLAFGYGQVFSPSDYLNPRNPLMPDARLRGILGVSGSFYPPIPDCFLLSRLTDARIQVFAAAPRNPLNSSGKGFLFGLLGEQHWETWSVQGMYHYEAPDGGSRYGVHRIGMSAKVDLVLGVTFDALYQYNHEEKTAVEGLSASVSADYSFYEGKCYVIGAYLFSGQDSSTSRGAAPSGFANRHYGYAMFQYSFTDYTRASIQFLASFEDLSCTPVIGVEHEVFQGLTVSLTCQAPLDRDLFTGSGERGELGPVPPGAGGGVYALFTLKARLRF
ncbi:MAG: hypothetical protein LBD13_00510 [Spirochaetaceae bacterium]|jgi:hypothetical protein|nr:hypothetical protein [Spirochaetaceae bacterium]